MDHHLLSYRQHMQLQGLAPGTIYGRIRCLRRLAAQLPVPLTDATDPMLAAWRASLTHTPAVIAGYVSHVRNYYAWTIGQGLRTGNPAARLPVPRKPQRLPHPIAEDDLEAAVQLAPPRIRPWLVLAGWCGLRAKEIALLRAENIRLNATPPVIVVTAESTKGRCERAVPVCAWAVRELRACGLPARGWAFSRRDGKPGPNKPHHVSHMCADYFHELGLPATLHWLRHRFITKAYQHRNDVLMARQLAGHKSVATTQIYAQFSPGSAVEAVEALPVPEPLREAS